MRLQKYRALTAIGLREAMAYRFNAVMSLVTSLLYLLLYYAIWSSIAASGSIQGGLGRVMAYLVVGQVVSNTVSMGPEDYVGERVRRGTIVNELKRPVSLRVQMYLHEMGWAFFRLFSRGVPVLLAGMLFFNVGVPSPVRLGAFLVSLFLSFNLVFATAFLTSMLVFWTKVSWSIRMMRNLVTNLFSGVLFPLYLLPPHLKPVFNALPFQAMVDGPITVFLGTVTGRDILVLYGKQLAWLAVLFLAGQGLWSLAKRR
ncbi:MAG: ABC-2 family transporter protein, partial [Candidatus Nanohaloarchaea archaeon]|nr:ABC-2 family transporter protein [Candidatus Nanohaloarchaea archaeon]